MKILFYNHTGQVSGAERVLAMILARLNPQGFAPVVVCPESGALAKMVTELGVRVETIAGLEARFTWRLDQLARYAWSFVRVIPELRRKVTIIKPDLIHANSIRSGLVTTAATIGLGTAVVWHLHDLLPRHPLSKAIRIVASLSRRTRMIAVSEAVARNFRGRFSSRLKNRVSVILNAIDLDQFHAPQASPTGPNAVRAELGLSKDDLVLGIVGQLTPRKGQLELIGAFSQANVSRSTLLIVGAALFNRDADYAERLGHEARARGVADRVLLLGARRDIGRVMQTLDLLVVNSTVEPFGLVILEAMACGTPVLAAAVDGIPEIVEHGKNGWLVPPRDKRMLGEAIAYLSREPELRARLAAEGKKHVARNFSLDRYLTELESFYRAFHELSGHSSDELKARIFPSPQVERS
jgi:glycosyltransferase involved in cell wall biosynthesis